MDVPTNAFELFDNYKSYYQKNEIPVSLVSKTQMALIRCVVPALGGPRPKGKRSTQDELKAAMSFLQSVSLEQILNVVESVRTFMEEENLPKTRQREHWTYLKKLINWATEQEYITKQLNVVDSPSENSSFSKGEIRVKGKDLNLSNEQTAPKYALGYHFGDYITFALHSQLEDYRKFLIEERGHCDSSQSTVAENLRKTNLLLGWLHRQKNVPLDDLSLELIVPLLKTKPNRAECKDCNGVFNKKAYLDAKRKLEEQARRRREETISLVKNFLDEHSKVMATRINDLATIINIAKFIYKNETNTKVARNFEDIEIIELLREVRRNEVNNFKRVRISRATNNFSWDKVLKVLFCAKQEADTEFSYTNKTLNKLRKKDGVFPSYKAKFKRSEYTIARNLQTFLVIAFVVLLTPDRQQLLQEICIGVNLRKGIITKGKFVPQEDIKKENYNSSKVMWYQYTGDYKIIDFNEDFWGKIPDFNLGDKTLYYYIDEWLGKYRTILLKGKKECDRFFIDARTGKGMNTKFLWNLVRERFQYFVGISVTPQALIHSYKTYLETVSAPPEVKKTAAEWMNCKDETAENFYLQIKAYSVEPALKYNEQMAKDYFSNVGKIH
jgi:hypothetical protein